MYNELTWEGAQAPTQTKNKPPSPGRAQKTMQNVLRDSDELIGAIANLGSGPYLVETEEQAESLKESIERATIEREITDEDELETAKRQLDLDGYKTERILSFVDGSEFLVCLPGEWYY